MILEDSVNLHLALDLQIWRPTISPSTSPVLIFPNHCLGQDSDCPHSADPAAEGIDSDSSPLFGLAMACLWAVVANQRLCCCGDRRLRASVADFCLTLDLALLSLDSFSPLLAAGADSPTDHSSPHQHFPCASCCFCHRNLHLGTVAALSDPEATMAGTVFFSPCSRRAKRGRCECRLLCRRLLRLRGGIGGGSCSGMSLC